MWELTVVDEARLCVMECRMIRMMCGARLADRLLTDVLQDRVGFVVKIEDMISHVMHEDIDSQILQVMEVEITAKRKKVRPRSLW